MAKGTYGNQCINCGFLSFSLETPLDRCPSCEGLELHVWLVPYREPAPLFARIRVPKLRLAHVRALVGG